MLQYTMNHLHRLRMQQATAPSAIIRRRVRVGSGVVLSGVLAIGLPVPTQAAALRFQDAAESTETAVQATSTEEVPAFEDGPTLDALLGLEPPRAGDDNEPGAGAGHAEWSRLPDIRAFLEAEDLRARQRAGIDSAAAADAAAASGAGSEMEDLFVSARNAMKVSADRLGTQRDTGLTTQRYQEDVLRNLDMLIAQAQQNLQQQQQQQSSSTQQQQQDPNRQAQRDQTNQQNSQNTQAGSQASQNQDARPPRREGELTDSELAEAGVEWGALPARVRNMLLQGRTDRASSLYQRLTELYYQRLAEEAAQQQSGDTAQP